MEHNLVVLKIGESGQVENVPHEEQQAVSERSGGRFTRAFLRQIQVTVADARLPGAKVMGPVESEFTLLAGLELLFEGAS